MAYSIAITAGDTARARCGRASVSLKLHRDWQEIMNDMTAALQHPYPDDYCASIAAALVGEKWDAPGLSELTDGFLRKHPTHTTLLNQRGWIDQQRGEMANAYERFLASAKLGDRYGQMMAGKYLFSGVGGIAPDREEGLKLLQAAAAQGEADAQYSIVEALELMGRSGEVPAAQARYQQLKLAARIEPLLKQAEKHLRLVEFNQAIVAYDQALALDPNNVNVMVERGLAHSMTGDLKSALQDYGKAIGINPALAEAYHYRGRVYAQDPGTLDQAIADFTKALELDPKPIQVRFDRGGMYLMMNQFDQSLADFNQIISAHRWFRGAYMGRILAYYFKGEYGKILEGIETLRRLGIDMPPEFIAEVKAKIAAGPSDATGSQHVPLAVRNVFDVMKGMDKYGEPDETLNE